jgi:hypothetical protein
MLRASSARALEFGHLRGPKGRTITALGNAQGDRQSPGKTKPCKGEPRARPSVPNVAFIVFDLVALQEPLIFLLKGASGRDARATDRTIETADGTLRIQNRKFKMG